MLRLKVKSLLMNNETRNDQKFLFHLKIKLNSNQFKFKT